MNAHGTREQTIPECGAVRDRQSGESGDRKHVSRTIWATFTSTFEVTVMRTIDRETLNANVDKVVKIVTRNGESLLAKVVLVSEEDEDMMYELVSMNRESNYEKYDEQRAYRITFQEIQSVQSVAPVPPPSSQA
jgi:hypothetical protein